MKFLAIGLVHNMMKMHEALDATLKRKDKLDIYPGVADARLDTSDHDCYRFIVNVVS